MKVYPVKSVACIVSHEALLKYDKAARSLKVSDNASNTLLGVTCPKCNRYRFHLKEKFLKLAKNKEIKWGSKKQSRYK